MKRVAKPGRSARAKGVAHRLLALVYGPMVAVSYCLAAERDEKNGYHFTAAFEWRKAAELTATIPPMADHCWKQWERIMNLPRRLAESMPSAELMPAGAPSTALSETLPVSEDGMLLSAA
jgi:hypothetical protein